MKAGHTLFKKKQGQERLSLLLAVSLTSPTVSISVMKELGKGSGNWILDSGRARSLARRATRQPFGSPWSGNGCWLGAVLLEMV